LLIAGGLPIYRAGQTDAQFVIEVRGELHPDVVDHALQARSGFLNGQGGIATDSALKLS